MKQLGDLARNGKVYAPSIADWDVCKTLENAYYDITSQQTPSILDKAKRNE